MTKNSGMKKADFYGLGIKFVKAYRGKTFNHRDHRVQSNHRGHREKLCFKTL